MTGITITTPSGVVMVDMTKKLSQTILNVTTGGSDGAIAIPLPPAGKQAYYVIVPLVDMQRELGKRPGVTITLGSGSGTLSWSYSYPTNGWGYFSANCQIFYGYY